MNSPKRFSPSPTVLSSNSNSNGNSNGISNSIKKPSDALLSRSRTMSNMTLSTLINERPKDQRWGNRVEFVLSLIGYAVGVGNVWRFSYYCQKNGGGAFLFPYLIMLFVLGIPLYFMELQMGKVAQIGPLQAMYRLVPALGGVGGSIIITLLFIIYYYNMLISYSFFYLFSSFQDPPAWGNVYCGVNLTAPTTNFSLSQVACKNFSSNFFYYTSVTLASDDLAAFGQFNWKLFLCIIGSWVLLYVCTFRGIKSSGKVVYFTVLFPYVVLVILFFRAVTLPGAGTGLEHLFVPDTEKLYNPQVWLEAGTQIFYSLGLGLGCNIILASHLDPNTNVIGDGIFVAFVNSGTSIFASIIVFSILGYQAELVGTSVKDIVAGPGLIFVAFASALLQMPLSPLWSILFFIMLILLGLDSQFSAVESVVQAAYVIPKANKLPTPVMTLIICLAFLVLSIFFAFGNGGYIFQLLDQFSGSFSIFLVVFFEVVGVAWVYGVRKLLTYKIGDGGKTNRLTRFLERKSIQRWWILFWQIMWIFVAPTIMIVIFIGSLVIDFIHPLKYTVYRAYKDFLIPYPAWGFVLAAGIVISTILPIPIILCVKFKLQWLRDLKNFVLRRKRSTPIKNDSNEDHFVGVSDSVRLVEGEKHSDES
ncbi:Sodium- and chloride-dependent betaine transporter-like [Oopsacas minuta]|uniref:Sodium- and chloride-dependent betaine transporter-like n=1 Tax=Oopsacas minuta TaxID=111878 RepID=A0AAV7K861_9METZ|nr:Sodium- and chloride-dependent betaine transporter-like [Oopsacas minuta]